MRCSLLLLLLLHTTAAVLLLAADPSASASTLGVTYNPSNPSVPPPELVASALRSIRATAVRLLYPTPASVRAFSGTNISLLVSVPNRLIPSFATNRSAAALWLYSHVLPFHPRTRISLISAGSDFHADNPSSASVTLLPAMRNLHLSLIDLGIRTIPVSTTFSFTSIIRTSFPPSSAEFQEPISSLIIRPLLLFLEENNAPFLINLYPYTLYRINSEIPIGFALFEQQPLSFREDALTGVRYQNLFDMMVDAVVAAMAVTGQENIPVIVAETGWPGETENHGKYSELYLKGLITHLRSGMGTPLRKGGATEAYIYQLFDEQGDWRYSSSDGNGPEVAVMSRGAGGRQHWGIMHRNLTMKYDINFSGSSTVPVSGKRLVEMVLASLVTLLLLSCLV